MKRYLGACPQCHKDLRLEEADVKVSLFPVQLVECPWCRFQGAVEVKRVALVEEMA